jgi:hypothetical protein
VIGRGNGGKGRTRVRQVLVHLVIPPQQFPKHDKSFTESTVPVKVPQLTTQAVIS